MMCRFLLAGVATAAMLAGCAQGPVTVEPTYESAARSEFVATNYRAAEVLIGQFKSRVANGPVIVATAVNIDALEQSSTLGRLVSEQISSRFAQSGFTMIEMKFRNNVYMKRGEGELLLTREINDVARSHNAQAVIVGTYGMSNDSVFVNMKIVEPGTNKVLAVNDYVLPLNRDVRSMLSQNTTNRR